MVVEEWLLPMKRSMNDQKIPDDLKVTIACTYLVVQVYHWWESVLAMPNMDLTTWDAFEVLFLEK